MCHRHACALVLLPASSRHTKHEVVPIPYMQWDGVASAYHPWAAVQEWTLAYRSSPRANLAGLAVGGDRRGVFSDEAAY